MCTPNDISMKISMVVKNDKPYRVVCHHKDGRCIKMSAAIKKRTNEGLVDNEVHVDTIYT